MEWNTCSCEFFSSLKAAVKDTFCRRAFLLDEETQETIELKFDVIQVVPAFGILVFVVYVVTGICNYFGRITETCVAPQSYYKYAGQNKRRSAVVPRTETSMERTEVKVHPINILSNKCKLRRADPLIWVDYDSKPDCAYLYNSGHGAVLSGIWSKCTPNVHGGPLRTCYYFQSAIFRWGRSDLEGSQHMVDYISLPLELQLLHVGLTDRLAISCLFEITAVDNPFLDAVVCHLHKIRMKGAQASLPPFPLDWLLPSFHRGYFVYSGIFLQNEVPEPVTWIVYPLPIAVSSRQVAEFRKLHGEDSSFPTSQQQTSENCSNYRIH